MRALFGTPMLARRLSVAVCLLALAAPAAAHAQVAPPQPPNEPDIVAGGLRLRHLVSTREVTSITAPPVARDTRVFFARQEGYVYIVKHGRLVRRPFIDIHRQVLYMGGEEGFLGLAFHPDFRTNRLLYAYFTNLRQDIEVREFRASKRFPDRVTGRGRTVLTWPHRRFLNHWAGQMQFGPDRLLYIGVGDGGGTTNPLMSGQDKGTLLAKILRIDPRRTSKPYTVPRFNPFVGQPGVRPEIFIYGVRNPWRFSFDRQSGDLWLADVQADGDDEVYYFPRGTGAGANLGWCDYEGTQRFCTQSPDHEQVPPTFQLPKSKGYCAAIGGYVVRDPALRSLYGKYLYGDYCRQVFSVATNGPGGVAPAGDLPLGAKELTSFGEDSAGHIYVGSRERGLYRLLPAG